MRPKRERPKGSLWERAEGVRYLRRLGDALERTPTVVDMEPYAKTFWVLFDGISKAQAAAGFQPNPKGRPRQVAS